MRHGRTNHRPHRLLEVGPAVDRPERIECMGGTDHRLSRSGQRLQRRQCQLSVTGRGRFRSRRRLPWRWLCRPDPVDTSRRITTVYGLLTYFGLGWTAGSDSSAKTHECPRRRSKSCPTPLPKGRPRRLGYHRTLCRR